MHMPVRFENFPPNTNHRGHRHEFWTKKCDTEMQQKMAKRIPGYKKVGSCLSFFGLMCIVFA